MVTLNSEIVLASRMTNTYGNILSNDHSEALLMIVKLYSLLSYANDRGRYAMDLPTGAGKSSYDP